VQDFGKIKQSNIIIKRKVAQMSQEQIRAQRVYLDAIAQAREADENIDKLQGELGRWQRIKQDAKSVGESALAEITGSTIDEANTDTSLIIEGEIVEPDFDTDDNDGKIYYNI
jgi:hypothetical protein